ATALGAEQRRQRIVDAIGERRRSAEAGVVERAALTARAQSQELDDHLEGTAPSRRAPTHVAIRSRTPGSGERGTPIACRIRSAISANGACSRSGSPR